MSGVWDEYASPTIMDTLKATVADVVSGCASEARGCQSGEVGSGPEQANVSVSSSPQILGSPVEFWVLEIAGLPSQQPCTFTCMRVPLLGPDRGPHKFQTATAIIPKSPYFLAHTFLLSRKK